MTEEAHGGRRYLIDKCRSDNKAMNNNYSSMHVLDTSVRMSRERSEVGKTEEAERGLSEGWLVVQQGV